jgi:hypothetical protein
MRFLLFWSDLVWGSSGIVCKYYTYLMAMIDRSGCVVYKCLICIYQCDFYDEILP